MFPSSPDETSNNIEGASSVPVPEFRPAPEGSALAHHLPTNSKLTRKRSRSVSPPSDTEDVPAAKQSRSRRPMPKQGRARVASPPMTSGRKKKNPGLPKPGRQFSGFSTLPVLPATDPVEWCPALHTRTKDGFVSTTLEQGPRRCLNCGTPSTPRWRLGVFPPYVFCNACGLFWQRHQQMKPIEGKKTKPVPKLINLPGLKKILEDRARGGLLLGKSASSTGKKIGASKKKVRANGKPNVKPVPIKATRPRPPGAVRSSDQKHVTVTVEAQPQQTKSSITADPLLATTFAARSSEGARIQVGTDGMTSLVGEQGLTLVSTKKQLGSDGAWEKCVGYMRPYDKLVRHLRDIASDVKRSLVSTTNPNQTKEINKVVLKLGDIISGIVSTRSESTFPSESKDPAPVSRRDRLADHLWHYVSLVSGVSGSMLARLYDSLAKNRSIVLSVTATGAQASREPEDLPGLSDYLNLSSTVGA